MGGAHSYHISGQVCLGLLAFLVIHLVSSLPHQIIRIQALFTLPTISHCVFPLCNRPRDRLVGFQAKQTFNQETMPAGKNSLSL